MSLCPRENRFRSIPAGPELGRSDRPDPAPHHDPVELLCEELCQLKGKRVQVASIVEDAIPYVGALYPEATPYGGLGHWTWVRGNPITGEIVAEAWPAVGEDKYQPDCPLTGWYLRIKKR